MADKPTDGLVDPSERATRVLDHVLMNEGNLSDDIVIVDDRLAQREAEKATSAETPASVDAIEVDDKERILFGSNRDLIRVLMISTDRGIFVPGSQVQQRMQSYSALFDELHIIVYSLAAQELRPLRLAPNVWAYPTNSRNKLLYAYDAYVLARTQLSFSEGFRADLISAQDPFEAGLAGYAIARRFKRALQLQLHTDPFEPSFVKDNPLNKWRILISRFLFPRADGIRVVSDHLKTILEKRYKKKMVGKIDVLPVFSDVTAFRDTPPAFDLHERYPHMKFIILMASRLTKEKRIDMALELCAPILRQYPTVGMVIVGDGPLRATLEKRAADLGIRQSVVFEGWQEDTIPYFKTANLFLNTSSYEGYGRTLTEAAAAGLPVITSNVGIAQELFGENTCGFVCPIDDAACFARRINEFLNDNQLRIIFAKAAQERVFKLMETNVGGYLEALQSGMELCVLRYASLHSAPQSAS